MSTMHLYPKVARKARSFKGIKEVTMPDQSMSLREIIKRFVRKESLPIQQQGFYEDRFGDLEKLAHEDIVIQLQRATEIKDWLAVSKAKQDKLDAEAKAKAEELSTQAAVREAQLDALLKSQAVTVPPKQ